MTIYKKHNNSPIDIILNTNLNKILMYYSNEKKNNNTILITINYDNTMRRLMEITDYFMLSTRMKCKLETNEFSPYELFTNAYNKKIKLNYGDIKHMLKNNSCTLLDFTRIIYLLNKLLPNNQNIKYLDCSAGWGDRILASLLYGVSEYRGYDPNILLKKGHSELKNYVFNNNLNGFYQKNNKKSNIKNFKIIYKPFEISYKDEDNLQNYFDICISSPPFFIFEIYSNMETQSVSKNSTVNDWVNNFLYPSFIKILKMLKPNGYICWYLEDKPEYLFMDEFLNFTKTLQCIYNGKIGFKFDDANETRFFNIWQKV